MYRNERLDAEIRLLGRLLGEVIREQEGPQLYGTEEEIRLAARARRNGDREAGCRLEERVRALSGREARTVVRAFTIFFDLANLAEDRQRVRVLRQRAAEGYPLPRSESAGDAVGRLRQAGTAAEAVQRLLERLDIEPVFTAHPSEAKRRTVRREVRRLWESLAVLDRADLLPREREDELVRMRACLTALWQTDLVRPNPPTVLEEVEVGLHFASTLWEVIPRLHRELGAALEHFYPAARFRLPVPFRFGSWIGGDRDGNPNVDAEVTARAFLLLRRSAVSAHLERCRALFEELSPSTRRVPVDPDLEAELVRVLELHPGARRHVEEAASTEVYRRFLRLVEWRLRRTLEASAAGECPPGAYRRGEELLADLGRIDSSLRAHRGGRLADGSLRDWLVQAATFGLHQARLDIRQNSAWNEEVLAELLGRGASGGYAELPEGERVRLLERTTPFSGPGPEAGLSARARETLALFALLRRVIAGWGREAVGPYVVSMTHRPSDLLAVLWLAGGRGLSTGAGQEALPLEIVPLFETIGDLEEAAGVLERVLLHPAYRAHLRRLGDVQTVMIGYSDSTKDGGYLSANWALYRAQGALFRAAARHGVRLIFFHGRGGSLGRGGGPAARGILSLPPESLSAGIRMTEQGEVLADRYDDPQIALRHLEQVFWATLLSAGQPPPAPAAEWLEAMEELSAAALSAWRGLVEAPGFLEYFEGSTPIEQIESLPIGSRPARRSATRRLEDLRAIPWVFSWTQSRYLLPAWYGIGTAFERFARGRSASGPDGWRTLARMYREWPFFRATLDNAALALAKADLEIARLYALGVESAEVRERIWSMIAAEYERSRAGVLKATGQPELLEDVPWLQGSIRVRNPNTDPLSFIQVEWLRRSDEARRRGDATEQERLRDLLRLTVQGVAAGLRTTG